MNRLAILLLGAVLGVLLGAGYGWFVSPVEYTETSPGQLQARYRADYVLMVAETYAQDRDLTAAAVRLSRLGRSDLAQLAREVAQAYADAGYPAEDQGKLNDLARDLARQSSLPVSP